MRLTRYSFIFLAIYYVFIGGSAFYSALLPMRIFHQGFITILAVIWLGNRIRQGRGLPVTPLNPGLYVAVGVWFISAVFSVDPRLSFEAVWMLMVHLLVFFVLANLLQHRKAHLVMETQFIIGAMVVMFSIAELAAWYTNTGLSGIRPPLERLGWAMGFPNWLAAYTAPLVIIALGWALSYKNLSARIGLGILGVSVTLILILTGTRGGYMSLGAGLVVFALLRVWRSERLKLPRPVVIGGVIIGIIGLIGVILVISDDPGRVSGDAGRLDLYRSAVEMTVDYPVTGVGVGVYGRMLREYRDPFEARDRLGTAHNGYLSTLAESGIIGGVVSLWIGFLFLRAWLANLQRHRGTVVSIRLEAMFAALMGMGVHSLVDVFQIPSVVTIFVLTIAYCVIAEPPETLAPPHGRPVTAGIAMLILIGFGVWLIGVTDRAQSVYENGLRNPETALEDTQTAMQIDPHLSLYDLRIAEILGERYFAQPFDTQLRDEAIDAYETALALEPTWHAGWLNLAALEEARGNTDLTLLDYARRANAINPLSTAPFSLARVSEAYADDLSEAEKIALYEDALRIMFGGINPTQELPLSDFWMQTDIRRTAILNFLETRNIERQYRIVVNHEPLQENIPLASLVPDEPESAPEWWVIGEHALTVENDPARAYEAFSEAIERNPVNGDYYASRARAALEMDAPPIDPLVDADTAVRLGTFVETPYAIIAMFTDDPEARYDAMVQAVPERRLDTAISGILFGGRFGRFDLVYPMRHPGPSHAQMQPWYTLAEEAETEADAIEIYLEILGRAPYETEAAERLVELGYWEAVP